MIQRRGSSIHDSGESRARFQKRRVKKKEEQERTMGEKNEEARGESRSNDFRFLCSPSSRRNRGQSGDHRPTGAARPASQTLNETAESEVS